MAYGSALTLVKTQSIPVAAVGDTVNYCITINPQVVTPKADIVWVIDRSGSMNVGINKIIANLQYFTEQLSGRRIDYRLGLETFVDGTYENYGFAANDGKFTSWLADIPCVGGVEPDLEALYEANKMPWRPDASKTMILITDEAIPCLEAGGDPLSVSLTANDLFSQGVIIHAITYNPDHVGYLVPGKCNPIFLPPLAGGIWLNYASPQSDWNIFLQELGEAVATMNNVVIRDPLPPQLKPVASSIGDGTINGNEIDWGYDQVDRGSEFQLCFDAVVTTPFVGQLPNTAYGSADGITETSSNITYLLNATFTVTQTFTPTPTYSATPSCTMTFTGTATPTYSRTPSMTCTRTYSASPTSTPTYSPTYTASPTFTRTASCTYTYTATYTATQTYSRTATPTFTQTPTFTPTFTVTATATQTSTPSWTLIPTQSYTLTSTCSATVSATPTSTPTFTFTATATPTATKDTNHYLITAPSTVAAGTPFYITVTAITSAFYGSVVADNYAGTAHFTTSSILYNLPGDYTYIPATDAGSHIFLVTLTTPGMQAINGVDTVNPSINGQANILVTSGSAVNFTIDAPSTAAAGSVFYITVTAKDVYNNVVTGYTGTVGFEDTDPQWTSPGDTSFTIADQGKKVLAVTMRTAGIQIIYCQDIIFTSINGTSNNILITHGALSKFTVFAPTIVNTGSQFSYVVTARDAYNNIIDDYTGTVHFTSSDPSAVLPADLTFLTSDAGSRIFAGTLATTGIQTISVNDTVQTSRTGTSNNIDAITPPVTYDRPLMLTSYLTQANHYEFCYVRVDDRSFTFTASANYLEYDVYVPGYSSNFYCSTEFQDGNYPGTIEDMRDFGQATQNYIKDQNGIRIHPSMDISAYAKDKWYHRQFDVSALQPAGYYGNGYLSQDTGNIGFNGAPSNNTGTFNAFFNNITVKNSSGSVVHSVFSNDTSMKIGAGAVMSDITAPSWRSTTTYPLDNYVWIIDGWRGWVTPAAPVIADGYQCATITAYVWAPASGSNTKVAYAIIDFKSDRPEDIIDPVTVSLNSKAITDWNGNAFARIRSTKPGAANVTLSMGPYTRVVTVNFNTAPASRAVISPSIINTQTGVSSTLSVEITDANGNFVSDPRTITLSSNSGTMRFSTDNGSTWNSSASFAGTTAKSVLVKDTATGAFTATASAPSLASGTATINVNNNPASKLVILPPGSTAAAGSAVMITVQARDSSNNNANSNALVTLSSASGTMQFSLDNSAWAAAVSANLASGSLPLYYRDTAAASNITITAHDQSTALTDGKGYATITTGAAAQLDATANLYAVTAGKWVTITASVTDAYGNPLANTWVSFTEMVQGGKTQDAAVTPAGNSTNASGIVIAVFKVSSDAAGSMNYCVVNTAGILGKTVTISASGTAGMLSFLPAPMSLGADKTGTLSINAKDANGYNAPAPAGHTLAAVYSNVTSVVFSLDGINWYVSVTPTLNASGAATVDVKTHFTGTFYMTARDLNMGAGHLTDGANTLNVSTGYYVRVSPSANTAAAAGSGVTVTAQIVDQNGNTVGLQGVQVQFSTDNGFINPSVTYTDVSGRATSLLTLSIISATAHRVTAVITNPDDSAATGVITSSPVISFSVTAPSLAYKGVPFWVTVRARDANGLTVDYYSNTVTFSSTDAAAALPSNYLFKASDGGVKAFLMTLNTDGVSTVSAQQLSDASIAGASGSILVIDAPTPTATPTYTPTVTATITPTYTPTATRTVTPTVTWTGTFTATATVTKTGTQTVTQTCTATPSVTPTGTVTGTDTPSSTFTPTFTVTGTCTPTPTVTATCTSTPSDTPTPSVTPTYSATATYTVTPTAPDTATMTRTATQTATVTVSYTLTPYVTQTPTFTGTPTDADTFTMTVTPADTSTATATATPTSTSTATLTSTPYYSQTMTPTYTVTPTYSATSTVTITPIPPDAYEPDGDYTIAKRIYSFQQQTHNISPEGDVDWVVFTVTTMSDVTIETSGDSYDTEMWLYDPAGAASGTYLYYDDDGGTGAFSKIEEVLTPGTYYAKIRSYDGEGVIPEYFVDLVIKGQDPYEPDNTYTAAKPIASGDTQIHSLYPSNDADWVVFTLSATSEVHLWADGYPEGDVALYLYTQSGAAANTYLYYDANDGEYASYFPSITENLTAGTYYARVIPDYYSETIAMYGLNLTVAVSTPTATPTAVLGDAYEPDNTYAAAKPILSGIQQQHSIDTPADQDWVKFTVTQNSAVTIQTSGVTGDTVIYLYNSAGVASGTSLMMNDNGGLGTFSLINTNLAPDTYYVKVVSSGGSVIPSYYIQVDVNIITPTLTPTPVIGDMYENDDTFPNAKVILPNVTQQHSIHVATDVDWVKFTLTGEAQVTIYTSGSLSDTEMYLYDDLGVPNIYLAYDDNGGAGLFSSITKHLMPGVYYVRVNQKGMNATIDEYNITLNVSYTTPTATATPVAADGYEYDDVYTLANWIYNGVPQVHTINTPMDTDWVKFTIGVDSMVLIQTSGTTGATAMWLYSSTGVPSTALASNAGYGSATFAAISQQLPAGTYYVKVQQNGQNSVVPPYTITLNVSQNTPTSTPTATPSVTPSGDVYEYDGVYTSAKYIYNNQPQAHSISPAGDHDWVKFDVTAASTVTLETYGSVMGDTELFVYSAAGAASGSYIAYDDDNISGIDTWSTIVITLAPGTYYAMVRGYGDYTEVAAYNLLVSMVPLAAQSPTYTVTPSNTPTSTLTATKTQVYSPTATNTATISLNEAVDNYTLTLGTGGNSAWWGQHYYSYYDGDSAQSGTIGNNMQSFMTTEINGPGELRFYWKVSSEAGRDTLTLYDGAAAAAVISGEADWAQYIYTVTSGAHNIRWEYAKDASGSSGSDAGWVDKVEFVYMTATVTPQFTATVTSTPTPTATAQVDFASAVDQPGWTFSQYSPSKWYGETSVFMTGGAAGQSGPVANGQNSYVETTITGPGTLNFSFKVSSQAGDNLQVFVDGVMYDYISGEQGWVPRSYTLGAGPHIIRWIYSKDYSGSAGSDCGWIDGVNFTAYTPTPTFTPTSTATGTSTITSTVTGTPPTATFTPVVTSTPTMIPGTGMFWQEATAAAGFTARYYHTSAVFSGRMWVIGGMDDSYTTLGDVWSSTDGVSWSSATLAAAFPARAAHTTVVFNNKLWVIGGYNASTGYLSDVWSSSDGITWICATAAAPFGGRYSHTSVVMNNKMWVIGGYSSTGAFLNDVWSSPDGVNWTRETAAAPFSARYLHSSTVMNGKMWVVNGYSSSGEMSDVWSSPDGKNWSQVSADAGYGTRYANSLISYDGFMWMIAGYSTVDGGYMDDVWFSADGSFWTVAAGNADFTPRGVHTSVVFNNRLWVIAGLDDVTGLVNDVWRSPPDNGPTYTWTPTYTRTATFTRTPTITFTGTRTATGTATPTRTATNTATSTPTITKTVTATRTNTITPASTATATYSATPTITATGTPTQTQIPTLTTGLWHIIPDSQLPAGSTSTSPTAWYYGLDSNHTYDTGGRTFGSMLTAVYNNLAAGSVLSFSSWEETEGSSGADLRNVYISVDNGSTWVLLANLFGTEDSWYAVKLDISAYAGKNAIFRFEFDSVDGYANDFRGWYVDDIAVGAQTSTATITATPGISPTAFTPVNSSTATSTPNAGGTITPSFTWTLTATPTITGTPPTATATPTVTETITGTPPTATYTVIAASTLTPTPVDTATGTSTPNAGGTITPSFTWTLTATPTITGTPPTAIATPTVTETITGTPPTLTPSPAMTVWTDTVTATNTQTPVSGAMTFTLTGTPTISATGTRTKIPSRTATPSYTSTPSVTPTPSFTGTPSCTGTVAPSLTLSETPFISSLTPTSTLAPSQTITGTPGVTLTVTATPYPSSPPAGSDSSYVYPQPASDKVTFVYSLTDYAGVKIVVFNIAGMDVAELNADGVPGEGNKAELSLQKFAPGTYYYIIYINYTWAQTEVRKPKKFLVVR
jgi:hypothetical protein